MRMQVGVTGSPLVERHRPRRIRSGGDENAALALVPVLRGRVDAIPRELVDDEHRREGGHPVERFVERADVMEHATRDDRVVLAVEFAEVSLAEPLALGRTGIDADRVVAGVDKGRNDAARCAAADLEHTPRRRR